MRNIRTQKFRGTPTPAVPPLESLITPNTSPNNSIAAAVTTVRLGDILQWKTRA